MRRWWIVPTTTLGEITAVTVDSENQLWVLHRPRSPSEEDQPNAAPAAMLFDRTGTYVRGFGRPSTAWEWPAIEHSIAVDKSGRVWIAGNSRTDPGAGDDMLLEFTNDGKLIYQIGRRGASMGEFTGPHPIATDSKGGAVCRRGAGAAEAAAGASGTVAGGGLANVFQ